MGILVTIKYPRGIVLGADSLVTISSESHSVVATVPYYSKLFSIEPFPAGVLLNGEGNIGGRSIEDIVEEFSEYYHSARNPENYNLRQLAVDLARKIQDILDEYNKEIQTSKPKVEVIVAGFSRGKEGGGRLYGEAYSISWLDTSKPSYELKELFPHDYEFGTYYGGEPLAIDRFLYGTDDWLIRDMADRRGRLFDQARDYVIKEMRKRGAVIPKDISIEMPNVKKFDIFRLFSDYTFGNTGRETVQNIKYASTGKLMTMEKFFSTETALNYCTFLMSCAYAENVFTFRIPSVGSEMRIATITRKEGFKVRRIGNISFSLT